MSKIKIIFDDEKGYTTTMVFPKRFYSREEFLRVLKEFEERMYL